MKSYWTHAGAIPQSLRRLIAGAGALGCYFVDALVSLSYVWPLSGLHLPLTSCLTLRIVGSRLALGYPDLEFLAWIYGSPG